MATTRFRLTILTTFLALALAFFSGYAPAAAANGAATPEEAVQTLVKPFYTTGSTGSTCNALTGQLQDCPITVRLLDRLTHTTSQENGNIVSRSQNPPSGVTYTLLDNNGQLAHVNTTWAFGAGSYSITFAVVKAAEGWQVDDSFCAGQPNTTIFAPPTGPCPANASTGTTPTPGAPVPGVPTTGTPDNSSVTILIALAAAIIVAGLVVLFVSRLRSTGRR